MPGKRQRQRRLVQLFPVILEGAAVFDRDLQCFWQREHMRAQLCRGGLTEIIVGHGHPWQPVQNERVRLVDGEAGLHVGDQARLLGDGVIGLVVR